MTEPDQIRALAADAAALLARIDQIGAALPGDHAVNHAGAFLDQAVHVLAGAVGVAVPIAEHVA